MSLASLFDFSPRMRAWVSVRWGNYSSGYHVNVERMARKHGMKGWMRVTRQPVYSILEMEVEGRKKTLERFLTDLSMAPPEAGAAGLNIQWKNYKGLYSGFRQRV